MAGVRDAVLRSMERQTPAEQAVSRTRFFLYGIAMLNLLGQMATAHLLSRDAVWHRLGAIATIEATALTIIVITLAWCASARPLLCAIVAFLLYWGVNLAHVAIDPTTVTTTAFFRILVTLNALSAIVAAGQAHRLLRSPRTVAMPGIAVGGGLPDDVG
jgi:hypothetical protein